MALHIQIIFQVPFTSYPNARGSLWHHQYLASSLASPNPREAPLLSTADALMPFFHYMALAQFASTLLNLGTI